MTGERGKQGDHGQDGRTGMTGKEGGVGPAGPTGPVGRTGPTSPYLGRRQTLAIFAFIVVGFVLLAYRTEVSNDRVQRGVYEACLARAEIAAAPVEDCAEDK